MINTAVKIFIDFLARSDYNSWCEERGVRSPLILNYSLKWRSIRPTIKSIRPWRNSSVSSFWVMIGFFFLPFYMLPLKRELAFAPQKTEKEKMQIHIYNLHFLRSVLSAYQLFFIWVLFVFVFLVFLLTLLFLLLSCLVFIVFFCHIFHLLSLLV